MYLPSPRCFLAPGPNNILSTSHSVLALPCQPTTSSPSLLSPRTYAMTWQAPGTHLIPSPTVIFDTFQSISLQPKLQISPQAPPLCECPLRLFRTDSRKKLIFHYFKVFTNGVVTLSRPFSFEKSIMSHGTHTRTSFRLCPQQNSGLPRADYHETNTF